MVPGHFQMIGQQEIQLCICTLKIWEEYHSTVIVQ